MSVADATENDTEATPSNATDRAPERFAPLMDTVVPGGPNVGEKPVMVGGGGRCLDAHDAASVVLGHAPQTTPALKLTTHRHSITPMMRRVSIKAPPPDSSDRWL